MKHPMYDYPDVCSIVTYVGDHLNTESKAHDPDGVMGLVAKKFMESPAFSNYFNVNAEPLEQALGKSQKDFVREAIYGMSFIAITFLAIRSRGNICIDGSKYDWDSTTTRKTIDSLKLQQIKFPFHAGAIRMKDANYFFSYFSGDDSANGLGGLSLHKGNKEGDFITVELETRRTIGEQMRLLKKEANEFAYQIISILLYISSFKNNHERVEHKNIKAKLNRKLSCPQHKINYIILHQKPLGDKPKYHDGRSWESDKTWIVRGHWRRYASGDAVWIDQYWKGVGKKNIQEKVYEV